MGGPFLQIQVRPNKYLNNIVEQDHWFIKKMTKPIIGFKAFYSADATLSGIALRHILRIWGRGMLSHKIILFFD
jgi:putative transposase